MPPKLNRNAEEWTPFSGRSMMGNHFGLPVNHPMLIPLGPTPDTWTHTRQTNEHAQNVSPSFADSPLEIPSTPLLPQLFPSDPVSPLLTGDMMCLGLSHSPQTTITTNQHKQKRFRQDSCGGWDNTGIMTSSILCATMPVSQARAVILFHGGTSASEEKLIHKLRLFFVVNCATNFHDAHRILACNHVDAVITNYANVVVDDSALQLIRTARQVRNGQQLFVVCFSSSATASAKVQTECMAAGCNMVSDNPDEVANICFKALKAIGRDPFAVVDNTYECPLCHLCGFMLDELCEHVVLFHGGQPNIKDVLCPVCGLSCKNARLPFPVHVHKAHGLGSRTKPVQPKKQHHTYIFALVVCQRLSDNKFLVVNEPASWGWWIPGGRVEWGEGLRSAAVRETKEEAGVDVTIEGILKVEYSSGPSRTRQRIIFFARPVKDDTRPKAVPDYESRGACWVSLEELDHLTLRGEEPRTWFRYIADGGEVFPMSLLSHNRDEEEGQGLF